MDSAPPTRPTQLRRPKYVDLNLFRLPPPGLVSIIHRVTGALLFFPILPVLLYALATTLGSEAGYNRWHDFFAQPVMKLVLVGVVWLYAHHFFAGIRYLLLDLHIGIAKAPSRASALAVLALGVITAAIAAWCLW